MVINYDAGSNSTDKSYDEIAEALVSDKNVFLLMAHMTHCQQ
nr:MAG TPA: hypothetical protein [Crassvirales sp.]